MSNSEIPGVSNEAVMARALAAASIRDIPSVNEDSLPLIKCVCSNRSKEELLSILALNPDCIHDFDEKGYSALHWAAYFDETEAVKCLLDENASILNKKSKKGYTALHLAAQQNSLGALELLLNYSGVELKLTNSWLETALHLAAQNGNVTAVAAIKNASDESLLTMKDSWQRTAFDVAIENGYNNVAKVLSPAVSEEELVNLRKKQLEASNPTTIQSNNSIIKKDFLSALSQRKKIVLDPSHGSEGTAVLVQNMFSKQSETVFGGLTSMSGTESSSSLSSSSQPSTASASVIARLPAKRRIPISQKVEYPGDMESLKKMLADPTVYDVNGKDMFGLTVLHKFASWDKDELIECILSAEVAEIGLNLQCPNGQTALHYCVEFGALRSLKMLLADFRIDKSIRDKKGLTWADLANQHPNKDMFLTYLT